MNNLEEGIITKSNNAIGYKNQMGKNILKIVDQINLHNAHTDYLKSKVHDSVTDETILNTKIFKI